MVAVVYCEQNLLFVHPDHLCFGRTTYDNINGPAGPIMSNINGPAGPLMYPDQIFRDSTTGCPDVLPESGYLYLSTRSLNRVTV